MPDSQTSLRVLIIEDSQEDAELMVRELTKAGYQVDFTRVDTPAKMEQALETSLWDVVLSDHSMPKFSAPAALEVLRRRPLDIPFLIVSGNIGEERAVELMKAGATDYLLKEHLGKLATVMERGIRETAGRKAVHSAEAALRESEKLYRTLVQTSPDAILLCDLEGRIKIANPQTLKLLGWPPDTTAEEYLAWPVLAPDHSPDHGQIIRILLDHGRLERKETLVFRRDSTEFWADVSGSLMHDSTGKPESILLVMQDISLRKQSEGQILRQINRLAALRTIDSAITGSLDLNVILRILLDEVTNQLHTDAADILIFHPHMQSLRFAEGRGFRASNQKKAHIGMTTDLAGLAAMNRRSIVVRTPEEIRSGLSGRVNPSENFHFYMSTPLVAKGQIRGVLEIFHRSPMESSPEWVDFFETVAGQAAIAIDNALLFEELQRTNTELNLAFNETIEGWSRALDQRHHEPEDHTLRVTELTLRIARLLGVPESDLVHMRRGCLLHDVGKMDIPESILLKRGPLTDDEWNIIRQHPVFAFELLSPITILRPAMDIPYCHHERFDGSGYPRGLRREQIPLAARIFAIIDVWDSLHTARTYRAAWPEEQILAYMRSLQGVHFDPEILRVFLEHITAA